jgi:hypothetical protein
MTPGQALMGPARWHRPMRTAFGVVLGCLVLYALVEAVGAFTSPGAMGWDYRLYMDATRRWLAGGPFYPEWQTAGPYEIGAGSVLYPPVALVLLVPFSFLPGPLWVAVPAGVVAWSVVHHRPRPWAWLAIAATFALSPLPVAEWYFGTPTIWFAALLGLATVYRWPAALILVKPAILPFALVGARDRRWWLAAAALAAVSAVFLPMWADWVRVLLNARGPRAGILYAALDVWVLAPPVIAWLGRSGRHAMRLNQSTST